MLFTLFKQQKLSIEFVKTIYIQLYCSLHLKGHCYGHPMEQGRTLYFALWFLLLSSFFFPSPNLSHRRLDVCHSYDHLLVILRYSWHWKQIN